MVLYYIFTSILTSFFSLFSYVNHDLSFQPLTMDSSDPPFHKVYKSLFENVTATTNNNINNDDERGHDAMKVAVVEEFELPMIDLRRLELDGFEREECKTEIARASKEWGFFQVMNHGISKELLQKMKSEQEKVFKESFDKKRQEHKYFRFSEGSYRWGSPAATSLKQLSWSEAFHVPLHKVNVSASDDGLVDDLSSTMEQFAATVSSLALKLAEILAEKLGHKSTFFHENCLPSTCYLRMNRYPPCPIPSEVFGLMPHTDSDFLTILHQDQVGGLQLVKDDRWIAVKPNPEALIINMGDLFQAWSNNVYKSVQHRVVTNSQVERFSTAYFFCPSYETMIESYTEPSVYRKFSFGEYRHQVQEDVKQMGSKIGLPRFLISN